MKGSRFFHSQFAFLLGLAALKFSFCGGDVQSEKVEAWAHSIGAKIHNFSVQATGSAAVEKKLENLSFTTRENNGTRMVVEVSEKMRKFFNKKINSLRKIVAKAEEVQKTYIYDENIQPFEYLDSKNQESLAAHNVTYDSVFETNVTHKLSGIHVPTDIYDKSPEILNTIKWTEELDEVFINNTRDDPDLKWQFFGSETGLLRAYPGAAFEFEDDGIDLYDARKRPWYIHGSTSPKSVAIIVDSSGSMYGRPLLIARLAVGELIDTLSDNDFFNVIWFNINVNYLACDKKFVQATSQNKEFYKNRLRDIQASDVASWPKAYEAAFLLFQEDAGAGCQKVIMVFTDGPTERAEAVFEKYNSEKEVRVFTYAVGPPAHSTEALKSIACENKGFFYRIPGVGSVRDVVKGYVSVLSRPMAEKNLHDPIWSSVYITNAGRWLLITGTLPVFVRKNETGVAEILGVVGTDVTLKDIDRFFDFTSRSEDGYFFLINNNGHVIKHPAFDIDVQRHGYMHDPHDVYISDLEYSWDENSTWPFKLREKMLALDIGSMTFDVAMFSRDKYKSRVKKRTINYYFTKIQDTPMRVGIAIPSISVEIVPGNLTATETAINLFLEYWQGVGAPYQDVVETFVKTFDGSFNMSKPGSNFKPETGILGRVHEYPSTVTVLTVPYNSGKENAESVTLTGYRKMMANASGTLVNIGVVGFNMNHTKFRDDYFINPSIQDIAQFCNTTNSNEEEGYYCYLLDESAFVVAASVNSEKVSGQFFGNIDKHVMEELTTGGSTVIYKQIKRNNSHSSCLDDPPHSTSSAPFVQPFLSGTSYIKWGFAKAVWFLANLNIYNWLYGKPFGVTAETKEMEKKIHRSCIKQFTAYYSELNENNLTENGKANCEANCNSDSCRRSFAISKVPNTNLYLLVVDGHCPLSGSFNGVPGKPVELVRREDEKEEEVCLKDPYRKKISRCQKSDNDESSYPCGRCSLISASAVLLISTLLTTFCMLRV